MRKPKAILRVAMVNMSIQHLSNHISRQFNADLRNIHHQTVALAGWVEQQLQAALTTVFQVEPHQVTVVLTNATRITQAAVALERYCEHILVRQHPIAKDLRLVLTILKTIADLLSIADEAQRIANLSWGGAERVNSEYASSLQRLNQHTQSLLHTTINHFSRLDALAAIGIREKQAQLLTESQALTQRVIQDLRVEVSCLSVHLNLLDILQRLVRIGERCGHLAELMQELNLN